jgi:hypothetical protein
MQWYEAASRQQKILRLPSSASKHPITSFPLECREVSWLKALLQTSPHHNYKLKSRRIWCLWSSEGILAKQSLNPIQEELLSFPNRDIIYFSLYSAMFSFHWDKQGNKKAAHCPSNT